jgi:hypothetical protein
MAENTLSPEKLKTPANSADTAADPDTQSVLAELGPPTPDEVKHAVEIEQESKKFVPYLNEEYRFHLGGLGDLGPAYRLMVIFIFMLVAAAGMYMGAWWWVGTHPLATH